MVGSAQRVQMLHVHQRARGGERVAEQEVVEPHPAVERPAARALRGGRGCGKVGGVGVGEKGSGGAAPGWVG